MINHAANAKKAPALKRASKADGRAIVSVSDGECCFSIAAQDRGIVMKNNSQSNR
jgi:hypothetical protein